MIKNKKGWIRAFFKKESSARKMNKKGWIKIVEAFVSIMIIMSVLLIVINKEYVGKSDASEKIYEAETSILYSIVADDILRKEILNVDSSVENAITLNLQDKISQATPDYLTCNGVVCEEGGACNFVGLPDQNIYSQSIIVRDQDNLINSKVFKIFCWIK